MGYHRIRKGRHRQKLYRDPSFIGHTCKVFFPCELYVVPALKVSAPLGAGQQAAEFERDFTSFCICTCSVNNRCIFICSLITPF